MLIFSPHRTPRLDYILKLILNELLGIRFEITHDLVQYQEHSGPKLNYSKKELSGFQIRPSILLFESETREIQVKKIEETEYVCFGDEKHFDIFAASFYFVSRYEEHLKTPLDDHNRFSAEQSHLFKLGLLSQPIVNIWALHLAKDLIHKFPSLKLNKRKFEYISTIDIDQAWKYKYKGFFRTQGAVLRDLLDRNTEQLIERRTVLKGAQNDPFYNFSFQEELHAKYKTQVVYFIQVGKRGKYDKNQNPCHQPFQDLIKLLDSRAELGIHPSYQSNESIDLVRSEIETLESILERPIRINRQHFLMHKMPRTYKNLQALGIEEDYTMGYSTHMGFRAGIAAPFYFYDFENERETNLRLIPFNLMDITPMHYMGLDLARSIDIVKNQINAVHAVGGLFCTLWHNESLSESGRWQGWSPLYEEILKTCRDLS